MVWPLWSVTKSVMVTEVLQLVDEGELSFDDTINTYVDVVLNGEETRLPQLTNMTSVVDECIWSEVFSRH